MLSQRHKACILIALHKGDSVRRNFLGVIARRPDTEGLVASIGEHIKARAEDPIDTARRNLLRGGLCDLIRKLRGASSGNAHAAGILADINLIVDAVHAAILLVNANGKRHRMAGIMGNLLELIAQLGRVLGGWSLLAAGPGKPRRDTCQPCMKHMSRTFQILSGQQDTAEMVLLDKGPDLGGNCGSIEAHHEQLALCNAQVSLLHT